MTGPGTVRPGVAAGLVGTTGQIHQPVAAPQLGGAGLNRANMLPLGSVR
jgi:hypothetical protein